MSQASGGLRLSTHFPLPWLWPLVAPIPSIGQGLGTKFPLILNLIAADGRHGQSCSPCLHIDVEWKKGTERLKSLLLLAASGTTSIRQELRYKPPSPSMAEPPWPGTSADPPLQQTQRETHRRVSCNHLHAQQCHEEPPRCWGSGVSPLIWPPSTEPRCLPQPGAAAQARIKTILWHLTLFVTTPAKHHKWILWRTTICVLVSHNTPDSSEPDVTADPDKALRQIPRVSCVSLISIHKTAPSQNISLGKI